MVEGQPFAVYVDYAHTDDALRQVLSTLREITGQLGWFLGAAAIGMRGNAKDGRSGRNVGRW